MSRSPTDGKLSTIKVHASTKKYLEDVKRRGLPRVNSFDDAIQWLKEKAGE